MTGLLAAMAAAKSPPLTPLKAQGKLLGPKMTTGPIGAKQERIFFSRSRVAWRQDSSRTAAAAWRSWLVVRGSSTSLRRGVTGRAVSFAAAAAVRSAGGLVFVARCVRRAG